MKNYSKITPEGTQDFLFEECDARRQLEVTLSNLFKKRNYRKVITPTIEFYDVFNRESAGVPLENMYKLTDTRGRLLVLRPDNTMPIARIVATRLNKDMYPLRLYYTQSVFVQNPVLTGRNDEIAQTGIELVGAKGKRADLEVISIAYDSLKACGAPDFKIEIGHAGFFNTILNHMNITDSVRDDICKLIEAKNYASLNDLLDKIGESNETRVIKMLPRLFGGIEVIEKAQELYCEEHANKYLQYLKSLYEDLCSIGLDSEISIDLGIVNRSNYYSDIVFRGYIQGSGLTVLSGGRYDNLIGEFGESAPAIGFGVNVNALSSAMQRRGDVKRGKTVERLVFGLDGSEALSIIHSKNLSGINITNEVFVGTSVEEAKCYAKRFNIKAIDFIKDDKVSTLEMEDE